MRGERGGLRAYLLSCVKEPIFKVADLRGEGVAVYGRECSDRLRVKVTVNSKGVLTNLVYSGGGCVIFLGTFEALARLVIARRVADVRRLLLSFESLIGGGGGDSSDLGLLAHYANSPVLVQRLNCLELVLEAINKALKIKDMV